MNEYKTTSVDRNNAVLIYIVFCIVVSVILYLVVPVQFVIFNFQINNITVIILFIFSALLFREWALDFILRLRFNVQDTRSLAPISEKWDEYAKDKNSQFWKLRHNVVSNWVEYDELDRSGAGSYFVVFWFNDKFTNSCVHPDFNYIVKFNPYKGEPLLAFTSHIDRYESYANFTEQEIDNMAFAATKKSKTLIDVLESNPGMMENRGLRDIAPLLKDNLGGEQ